MNRIDEIKARLDAARVERGSYHAAGVFARNAPADIDYLIAELARHDTEITWLCAALRQTGQMKSIIGARRIVADALAACGEVDDDSVAATPTNDDVRRATAGLRTKAEEGEKGQEASG